MLLLQQCALRKFHVTDGQNMPDQVIEGPNTFVIKVHSVHSIHS